MLTAPLTDPQLHAAPDDTTPTARGNWLLGVLPFIGVILFVVNAYSIVTGTRAADWRTELVQAGVIYLIGWAAVGAAVMHICCGPKIARSIGWATSPFQFEVGVANLGIGVAGLMAAGQAPEFWWAVIVASSIFRIGCGVGHIRQMVEQRNFAVNNTTILFLNFVVPAFLLIAYTAWV